MQPRCESPAHRIVLGNAESSARAITANCRGPRWRTFADTALVAALHRALRFSRRIALCERAALVVKASSSGESELDLRTSVGEVNGQRNEGERLLGDASLQLIDLTTMEEEFSRSIGWDGAESARVLVRSDARSDEPDFTVLDAGVRVLEAHLPGAERFHLSASELESGFEDLEDVVFVTGAPVLRNAAESVCARRVVHLRPFGGCAFRASARRHGTRRYLPQTVTGVGGAKPEDSQHRSVAIEAEVARGLIVHCLTRYPEEGCGLLAAASEGGPIDRWYPTRNAAASARRYVVDPTDQLGADRAAEAEGRSIIGVFHSHTHTDAFPSPTDVAQAPDPGWFYVVVSLRGETPTLRSFRVAAGAIFEDNVEILANRAR